MAKAKMWKIGTNVEFYIDEFFKWMDEYEVEEGDSFHVQENKKNREIIFNFDISNGYVEMMDKTKAAQMIKILITTNVLKADGITSFENDKDMYSTVKYVINSNKNNWRENFINYLETVSYLDEEKDEEDESTEYIFKSQKNAIYSFMKAFEVYDVGNINEYSPEDKKVLLYWTITDLFRDFDKELNEQAGRIIHPLTNSIKKRKDLDSIEWKDLKIKNLNQVKEGEIESDLWNLADILSSSKNISIPIMQRKYVWGTNLIDKLMDDIFAIGETKPFHYIGSIVYKEKDNSLRILDGQQRLTSMFLILTAIFLAFISEDADEFNIKVPNYFKKIFPRGKEDDKYALHNRFVHVQGNEDLDEFYHILSEISSPKKNERGNMSTNFEFAQEKLKTRFLSIEDKEKQGWLETIFINIVERVAFTVNKNQIESEYSIFEKLNTLSEPLNQIDLLKNHILPYCQSEELDRNEQGVQVAFYTHISAKFEKKNKTISEAAVKRFVNYFIQLYGPDYLKDVESKDLKPFEKMSIILENKYDLVIDERTHKQFLSLLKEIGHEIDAFLSITDRDHYTNSDDQYYSFSDLLCSFEQRYVYAPLIKQLFDLNLVENLDVSKGEDRKLINETRKLLFEVERYELLLQVILYRGQSITNIIEKVIKEIKKISKKEKLTPSALRDIFSDEKIMSANLISPNIEALEKKVTEDSMADKVSLLILNRIKFWYQNNKNIELETTLQTAYLKKPTREHIMAQKIAKSATKQKIYESSPHTTIREEYTDEEFNRLHKSNLDLIGNILVIEQSDNSGLNNKSTMEKLAEYVNKPYLENDPMFIGLESNKKTNTLSLKTYLVNEELSFDKIQERSGAIAKVLKEIYA